MSMSTQSRWRTLRVVAGGAELHRLVARRGGVLETGTARAKDHNKVIAQRGQQNNCSARIAEIRQQLQAIGVQLSELESSLEQEEST